jgi:hypothetical protein
VQVQDIGNTIVQDIGNTSKAKAGVRKPVNAVEKE